MRLRLGGTRVTDDAEALAVLEEMTAQLRELNGAGLAAPQIGVPLALAAVEVRQTIYTAQSLCRCADIAVGNVMAFAQGRHENRIC